MTDFLSFLRERFLPFLSWMPELRDKTILRADIMAGITVALILVPQSMAYAQLAGLPAYIGLYASMIPLAIAALLGSSRQLATGPVAVASLMTAAAIGSLSPAPEQVLALALGLTFLVGVIQLSLGFLKLGWIIDFLSHPVLLGFTNAAALIIATSQLPKILGVGKPDSEAIYDIMGHHLHIAHSHYLTVIWTIEQALTHLNPYALAFGFGSIAMLYGFKKYAKKFPGVLITVVFFTTLSYLIDYASKVEK